jgi:hypothetical protein
VPAVFEQAVPPLGVSQVRLQSLRLVVRPATVAYAVELKNDCGFVAAWSPNAEARATLKASCDEVFWTMEHALSVYSWSTAFQAPLPDKGDEAVTAYEPETVPPAPVAVQAVLLWTTPEGFLKVNRYQSGALLVEASTFPLATMVLPAVKT